MEWNSWPLTHVGLVVAPGEVGFKLRTQPCKYIYWLPQGSHQPYISFPCPRGHSVPKSRYKCLWVHWVPLLPCAWCRGPQGSLGVKGPAFEGPRTPILPSQSFCQSHQGVFSWAGNDKRAPGYWKVELRNSVAKVTNPSCKFLRKKNGLSLFVPYCLPQSLAHLRKAFGVHWQRLPQWTGDLLPTAPRTLSKRLGVKAARETIRWQLQNDTSSPAATSERSV